MLTYADCVQALDASNCERALCQTEAAAAIARELVVSATAKTCLLVYEALSY
jgi:hypothetical protein